MFISSYLTTFDIQRQYNFSVHLHISACRAFFSSL